MCLILFALEAHPRYRLILLANRDEFFARRTLPLHEWEGIIAGRDVEAGGTWLGVSRSGRFAAVTNYREPGAGTGARSRGELVTRYLTSSVSSEVYSELLEGEQGEYAGFNLLFGDTSSLRYFSNRSGEPPKTLDAGVYGVSNALLSTPWPKVRLGVEGFERALSRDVLDEEALFEQMRSQVCPPDEELPDTGVGLERERYLSPAFIGGDGIYGTRCTSLLTISYTGEVQFKERTFDSPSRDHSYHFSLL